MNRNIAVTRTISSGNCSSATKTFSTPGDASFQTARRHSSAGIRALKWATASAWSLGSSFGSENRASKDNLFNIVVTPDSIPQFTIPSLAVHDGLRCFGKDRERQSEGGEGGGVDNGLGSNEEETECLQRQLKSTSLSTSVSSSSGFGSSPPQAGRAHRSISDPSNQKLTHFPRDNSCPLLEAQNFPDLATRGALSLPHLPKVTTPYGFVTLGQSPQMASEEALFFQVGHRRWIKDDDIAPYRHHMLDLDRNSSSQARQAQILASTSCPAQLLPRPPSEDHSISENKTTKQEIRVSAGHHKSRLWGVLHKHFTSLREKSS
ncbi:hypothetical protein AAFF_G00005600 [Aldrovandia affinis]|uniref:Uncharacterized protein n=1 Tax=Aldrovandia affinis TaxID=143900 RepID=A0AAD7TFN9_9TELE|nr:hypothetical protein AAFF_G00005600 [Aldrovandia affinis]